MLFNLVLGVLLVAYGVYTFVARRRRPEQLGKLDAMKRFWGEKLGYGMHVVAYSVLPVVFGLVLLLLGVAGEGSPLAPAE